MRVLVLSAPVGESHAEMARSLAADLRRRDDVCEVIVLNDFSVLGRRLGGMLERGLRRHLGEARQSYDVAYWAFTRIAPARRFGELALYRLGGEALATTIARHRPDVVVSTYPILNPVLARLRRAGRLAVPAAAFVGPLGGLAFWIAPGLDLHMLNYAEALDEVRRHPPGGPVTAVRPLVAGRFFTPGDRDGARAASDQRVVLVSGGGWGVGDLGVAIDACLVLANVRVVVIAGRNEAARRELTERHRDDARVTVLGFRSDMDVQLRAADAFVTATAGLSVVEALLCGCPAICFGFHVGHVRDNTAALARHGLARVATDAEQLARALHAALAERPQAIDVHRRPPAAELVAALAARSSQRG